MSWLFGDTLSTDNQDSPVGYAGEKLQRWTDPLSWVTGGKWADFTSKTIPDATNRILEPIAKPLNTLDQQVNPLRRIPLVNNVANLGYSKPGDSIGIAIGSVFTGGALGGAMGSASGSSAGAAGATAGTADAGIAGGTTAGIAGSGDAGIAAGGTGLGDSIAGDGISDALASDAGSSVGDAGGITADADAGTLGDSGEALGNFNGLYGTNGESANSLFGMNNPMSNFMHMNPMSMMQQMNKNMQSSSQSQPFSNTLPFSNLAAPQATVTPFRPQTVYPSGPSNNNIGALYASRLTNFNGGY